MDRISPQRRSENMRRIRSKDTSPELAVRRWLHGRGFRYRLHRKDLPGTPDLVFPGRRIAIFIHGCFWHGCPRCVDGTRKVKSNAGYWSAKVEGNRARDARHQASLTALGWRVLTIWECEVSDCAGLRALADVIEQSHHHPPKRP
jgi:DNA mismatch endonuclease (patch repair protein)